MKTNLLSIENQLIQLKDEYKKRMSEHEKFIQNYQRQKKELLRQKSIVMNGLDLNKIMNAESILRIVGLNYGQYNERCVTEAIKDIASGTNKMSKEYFGVKDYASWTHQVCDCEYGFGPRHGSIVFSVGLKKPNEPLTDEQKEDCLYYLNILRDKEAREKIVDVKNAG